MVPRARSKRKNRRSYPGNLIRPTEVDPPQATLPTLSIRQPGGAAKLSISARRTQVSQQVSFPNERPVVQIRGHPIRGPRTALNVFAPSSHPQREHRAAPRGGLRLRGGRGELASLQQGVEGDRPLTTSFDPSRGLLDHQLADWTVSMRVVANGEGSEVVATFFQPEGMDEREFEQAANVRERELKALKVVLER